MGARLALARNEGAGQHTPARPPDFTVRAAGLEEERLPRLSEVVRAAENAGFEILDVENLPPHYARICRAWVERLIAREAECRQVVGAETHRTWLLYLAASALNFQAGVTDVHQVLMVRRACRPSRPWTRRYMYA